MELEICRSRWDTKENIVVFHHVQVLQTHTFFLIVLAMHLEQIIIRERETMSSINFIKQTKGIDQ